MWCCSFELSVFTKFNDDMLQIVEEILPYFQPAYNLSGDLVSTIGEKRDIPLVLNSVTSEDTYEGDYASRRSIIWTLSFLMKGWLYPNVVDNAKVITDVTIDTHLMSAKAASPELSLIHI